MKTIRVGRSSGNDIVIQHDGTVSKVHCQFIMDDYGNYRVVDLNSTNGTYVNGVRRQGETMLQPNDTVRIGNCMLPWQSYFQGGGNVVPGGNGGNSNNGGNGRNGGNPPQQKPNNFLVWSILSTIFCCLAGGIVSIVYASKVDGLWASGDYNGAIEAAHKAKTWFWISFGVGIAAELVALIYYIVVGAAIFSLS